MMIKNLPKLPWSGLVFVFFMPCCASGSSAGASSTPQKEGDLLAFRVTFPDAGALTKIEKDLYDPELLKEFSGKLMDYLANETKRAFVLGISTDYEADPESIYPDIVHSFPGALFVAADGTIGEEKLSAEVIDMMTKSGPSNMSTEKCAQVDALIESGKDRSSFAYLLQAICFFQAGKAEESLAAFGKAQSINPYNCEAMLMIVVFDLVVNKQLTDEAYDILAAAYFLDPQIVHPLLISKDAAPSMNIDYLWKEGRPYIDVSLGIDNKKADTVFVITKTSFYAHELYFGMCKAAFRFEPDFREIATGKPCCYQNSYFEEFICYSMAAQAYETVDMPAGQERKPFMDKIVELHKAKAMRGFVLVDVLSVHYPVIPLNLLHSKPELAAECMDYIKNHVMPRTQPEILP